MWRYYSLLILAAAGVCCESAYTWSCSPPSGNVFYFPDIPATVSEIGSTLPVLTNYGEVYIYPTDSHNCGGTIIGVEYCYRPLSTNPGGNIFTLLIFDHLTSSTTNMDITRIPIPAPTENPSCSNSDLLCCDSYSFTEDLQFTLNPSNFIYGILFGGTAEYILYGFHNSVSDFQVNNAYLFSEADLNAGSFSSRLHQPLIRTLRIVRFVVDQGSGPTASTTDNLDPTEETPPLTTDLMSSSRPTTPEETPPLTTDPISSSRPTTPEETPPLTTDPISSSRPTTPEETPPLTTDPISSSRPTTSEETPPLTTDPISSSRPATSANTPAIAQLQGEEDSIVPTAVGVVVGLAVSLVLLCVVVVVTVMGVRKYRGENWKPEKRVSPDNTLQHDNFDNAVYENVAGITVVGASVRYTPKDVHDYASTDSQPTTNNSSATDAVYMAPTRDEHSL